MYTLDAGTKRSLTQARLDFTITYNMRAVLIKQSIIQPFTKLH